MRTVFARGRMYTTVPDVTTAYVVLVAGTVSDAVSSLATQRPRPPRTQFTVVVDRAELLTHVFRTGLYCVSGRPQDVYPGLRLRMSVTAAGYREGLQELPIPVAPQYPIVGQDVALSPLPIRLQGRVMQSAISVNAVARAIVEIADAGTKEVLALRVPVVARFPVGARVTAVTVAAGAHATTLDVSAAARAHLLALTSRGTLSPGDSLSLGWPDTEEFAVVDALGPGPNELTLDTPLVRTHKRGTDVREVTVGPAGPLAVGLAEPAEEGEGLIVLDAALAARFVELRDQVTGLRTLHAVGSVADSDGYFVLDGIGRVDTVQLSATAPQAAAAGPVTTRTIDYSQPVNVESVTTS